MPKKCICDRVTWVEVVTSVLGNVEAKTFDEVCAAVAAGWPERVRYQPNKTWRRSVRRALWWLFENDCLIANIAVFGRITDRWRILVHP